MLWSNPKPEPGTTTVTTRPIDSRCRQSFAWFRLEELKTAGVQATLPTSLLIEAFEDGWQKEWFSYKPELWGRSTHKVYDDRWKAPEGAKLAFEVRSAEQNAMVVGIDEYAAEVQLDWSIPMAIPSS